MAHTAQNRFADNSSTDNDDFVYPEPKYPYLYASSVGYTTPAVSSAPLPTHSVAPSHRSSGFMSSRGARSSRVVPERTYSDTSRTSGESLITPSVSISQAGYRSRTSASRTQPHSRATSFVSRDEPGFVPARQSAHTSNSRLPTNVSTSRPPVPTSTAGTFRAIRRLRSVLKKPRPTDNASYTSSSSVPDVIQQSPTEMTSPSPPPLSTIESSGVESDNYTDNRRSMAPSSVVQKTRFHGSSVYVSRHLGKPWDARSSPRLDSSARAALAFDIPGVQNVHLIVPGLPWSVHVRAASSGRSRSRSRTRLDQITVGDVVDSVYKSLNRSLTRTDVRAASDETKKRIARAAAAAEAESERGKQSAMAGKPSAARRIDFLGSRIWFQGLEKNDKFAREEGYGSTEQELKNVWVMRFGRTHPQLRSSTL